MASLFSVSLFSVRFSRQICRARNYDEGSEAPMSLDEFQIFLKNNEAKRNNESMSNSSPLHKQSPFKSIGSRSTPSQSSYPALFSKYSNKNVPKNARRKSFSDQKFDETDAMDAFENENDNEKSEDENSDQEQVKFGNYLKKPRRKKNEKTPILPPVGDPELAPMDPPMFEYKYSYTETPEVEPIGYREPQYSPFGPSTMSRPWTGGPPMKKSKKNRLPKLIPEFDSFVLPTKQKGVKPIHPPGPFEEGEAPKYVRTREEILGNPLSKSEINELVKECIRHGNRQVNLGRDGLVHNMLDLIHSHWKRRRVCKIKCKGVPTVDMDKVCQQIEDKTGGVIIHRSGGVLYLFRGRNYNFKLRPRFPLMLWKPPAPIYPRLIQEAPGGLNREEANDMRIKGRKIKPFCKLGKNGVYIHLVNHCRNEFLQKEIIKIDCKGLEKSDYKKIGAKLKDLVPCVLLSFEKEQILLWKGKQDEVNANLNGSDSSDAAEVDDKDADVASKSVTVRVDDSSRAVDKDESALKDYADENDNEDEDDSDLDFDFDDKSGLILMEDDIQTEKEEIKETLRVLQENAEIEKEMVRNRMNENNWNAKSSKSFGDDDNVSEMDDPDRLLNSKKRFENAYTQEFDSEAEETKAKERKVEEEREGREEKEEGVEEEEKQSSKYDFDLLWDKAVALGKIVPLDESQSNDADQKLKVEEKKQLDFKNEESESNSSDVLWETMKKNFKD